MDANTSAPNLSIECSSTNQATKKTSQASFSAANDKLKQLAMLSAAPLSGSISLRGEEFCMSPTDVKRSEVMLLSPHRYQQSYTDIGGEESPAKRMKFSETTTSFLKKTENISAQHLMTHEENCDHEAEEDIAQSLLRMKTAQALIW